MLDTIALGMVLEEDLTGYDIKKRIEKSIGIFYKASYGSLYPALKKLTEHGCLTTYEQPKGGRQRIYYRITQQGRQTFFAWLTAPMDLFEGTNTHLAKVYFFDTLPPEIRDRQLLQHEMNHIRYLEKLEALEKAFQHLENPDDCYYKLSTLYYGMAVTRQTIRWCRHLRLHQPLPALLTGGETP